MIAFEDLTGIRECTGVSWGHKWAFNRLYEYVEYKAAEYASTWSRLTRKIPRGVVRTVALPTQTTVMERRLSA